MYKDNGFFDDFYKEFLEDNEILNEEDKFKEIFKQIYEIRIYLEYLHDLIPLKYNKAYPKAGENPFFSMNMFKLPEDPKEYEDAKIRMANFLEKSAKQQT